MISQITWTQFWTFITVAVPVYYFIILLVYFRSETSSLISGRFISKTPPAQKYTPLSNIAQIIGSFEEESTYHHHGEKSKQGNSNNDEDDCSSEKNSSILLPSDSDEILISDDLENKINKALLEDTYLDEEFLARVNEELVAEQLEQYKGEIIAEVALEEEPWIDAEDFFQLIEQGIDSLEEEKRSQIMKSSLYKELFDHSPASSNFEYPQSGSIDTEQKEHTAQGRNEEENSKSAE